MNQNELIGKRIREARQAKGLSQEQLGEQLGVSFQAVSTWETGKFIPDSDHLPALAKALDLSLDALFTEADKDWELKPVNFDVSHMFTFVKGRAQMLGFSQTLAVMDLLRPAHGEQKRRSKYGFECPYMAHPLTMACHALARGLREDDVLAAALAHDMVEDASRRRHCRLGTGCGKRCAWFPRICMTRTSRTGWNSTLPISGKTRWPVW